jgi:hypothetical protein
MRIMQFQTCYNVCCTKRDTLEYSKIERMFEYCSVVILLSRIYHLKCRDHECLKERCETEEDKDFQMYWENDELRCRKVAISSKFI